MIRDVQTGNGSSGGGGSGNGSNHGGIKTGNGKDSRSSSQDIDLEDRLSSTSDSSMSHRLNDLGDVQNLARMQEESKSKLYFIHQVPTQRYFCDREKFALYGICTK